MTFFQLVTLSMGEIKMDILTKKIIKLSGFELVFSIIYKLSAILMVCVAVIIAATGSIGYEISYTNSIFLLSLAVSVVFLTGYLIVRSKIKTCKVLISKVKESNKKAYESGRNDTKHALEKAHMKQVKKVADQSKVIGIEEGKENLTKVHNQLALVSRLKKWS